MTPAISPAAESAPVHAPAHGGAPVRTAAVARVAARVALGLAFLSAVADRFGLWGRPGAPGVAWGDFAHFTAYTAQINAWWLPAASGALGAALAWLATAAELGLGVALLAGLWVRLSAAAAGTLLVAFALALTIATGPKKAFDFSVWSAAGGAFLLAAVPGPDAWSLDGVLARAAARRARRPGAKS